MDAETMARSFNSQRALSTVSSGSLFLFPCLALSLLKTCLAYRDTGRVRRTERDKVRYVANPQKDVIHVLLMRPSPHCIHVTPRSSSYAQPSLLKACLTEKARERERETLRCRILTQSPRQKNKSEIMCSPQTKKTKGLLIKMFHRREGSSHVLRGFTPCAKRKCI